MKHFILSVLLLSSLSVFGQETWNVCSQTVNVIPQPSYDSTFVLSAPSRAALAKGMANWTAVPAYKVYIATIAQSSTDAPVATVIANTLGGTVVWSYVATGVYDATLTDAFTTGKTIVGGTNYVVSSDMPMLKAIFTNQSQSACRLYSFDSGTLADDILSGDIYVEIRVYN